MQSTAWIFPLYFQLPYLPEETFFSKWDLLQWKVPASLSLLLKSEKFAALIYLGKGRDNRPFCDFRLVPSASRPWASGKGLVQVLLL
jgi:hypothetical protein